ncbi:hypothetical protein P3X46_031924 [Hevea brasiliensis]|uniref:Saposin B-type domain-containing protein n=1 Tax=Hevea brasiliensis TaxID=3981 RepID=A0ABQ9KMT4_HEVBR|nr:uncharacterized protein LOC110655628 [Hevea brasiliensis]XP_021667717.2 uncharacterized protein LOC110655628 [Hevea brasiliensis]KAJ9141382.1 hypothetical protein P3X46_031924 [Hevea brasiliensis]
MANIKQILVVLVTVLLVSTCVPVSLCAKKPVFGARKEDIPYIKCQVCEKVAKELYQLVEKKKAEILPKKISEYQIIEMAENICNLKKEEADWIMKIDIVEQGDKLELVEQEAEGQCNSECKTIERSCQEVMGNSDTDIAEYIFSLKPSIDLLVNYLCKDLTDACRKKPPPVPKGRIPGEPFVPKPSKEAEMEKILRSMEGMPGAPNMQMYSREDLMNMKNFGNEEADDDEDEDDDPHFPSKLAKVLREKESKKDDWKEKITKGIKTTGETLKGHANRFSSRMQQWWKRIKASHTNENS